MNTDMTANRNGRINIVIKDDRYDQNIESRKSTSTKENKFFKEIDETFSTFIAMEEMKSTLKQVYATYIINEQRKQLGIISNKQVLHMLFMGNPGTGKTTFARKLVKLYLDMGILSKGQFIEVERADLVGEYIGQTAQKTRALIEKAMGGILFIDEAYSLARGGEKDFGKEAIDTLVKHMEDHQNDFVLILAGYPTEMQKFLKLNPGIESRFPFVLDFPNYTLEELLKIARKMTSEREYKMTSEAELKLKMQLVKKIDAQYPNFSNARTVRNLIEDAIRKHAYRLVQQGEGFDQPEMLTTLTSRDFL